MTALPGVIEKRLKEIEAQIGLLGAELVDIEYKKSQGREILTVIADKPGGISLDDCVNINKQLSLWLDGLEETLQSEGGFIKGPYHLEVSSPGLDRALKTEKDLLRAIGQSLRVVCRETGGKVKVFQGVLRTFDNGIASFETKDGTLEQVALTQLVRANREISLNC